MSDSLSLLSSVEAAFDIQIADDEAEKTFTVGDLQRLVEPKLAAKWPQAPSAPCVSQMAFYRVRRALSGAGCQPRDLRPKSRLETLLPRQTRRVGWKGWSRQINADLPQLKFSPVLEQAIAVTCLLWLIGFLSFASLVDSLWIWPALAASFLFPCVMRTVLHERATHFPTHCVQLGDLARHVAATRYCDFVAARGVWTRAEVGQTLQWLVAQECELPISSVTPESRFDEDLDLD